MAHNYEDGMKCHDILHAISRFNDGSLLTKDYDTLVRSLIKGNFSIS